MKRAKETSNESYSSKIDFDDLSNVTDCELWWIVTQQKTVSFSVEAKNDDKKKTFFLLSGQNSFLSRLVEQQQNHFPQQQMSEKSEKSEKCVNVASKHLRKRSQMRETSAFMFLAVPYIEYCLVTDYTRSL